MQCADNHLLLDACIVSILNLPLHLKGTVLSQDCITLQTMGVHNNNDQVLWICHCMFWKPHYSVTKWHNTYESKLLRFNSFQIIF